MEKGYKIRHFFIDKNFQTKFILKFCAIVIISSLLIAGLLLFLSQGSTTVAIENTKVLVKKTADFILPILVQTIVVVLLFSSLAVIIVTLFASHKISGPLYRLKREVEALGQGDLRRNFNIRGGDQLQVFSRALKEMCNSLAQRHLRLKGKISKFREYVEGNLSDENKKQLFEILDEVEKEINNFRV
ncbi:MAG: hypothetical protein ACE5GG_02170 [Candidatus Omnitrophota bacterium]